MKKKMSIALAAGMLILGLTGCGENQIPNLTDDQMQMMGEFTAITLMRYDANHRSRLVDYTLLLESPEPVTTPEPEPTKKPAGMDPVDDTPVIGVNGQTGSGVSLEEVLGFPEGVNVEFVGRSLHDSYPEEVDGFGMTATRGTKLLVLSFSISNTTEQDQALNLLDMEPIFLITVNEDYSRKALFTGLENDFVTFRNTIPAGGSAVAELVIEIDSEMADNITSIFLKLSYDSKTSRISLL